MSEDDEPESLKRKLRWIALDKASAPSARAVFRPIDFANETRVRR